MFVVAEFASVDECTNLSHWHNDTDVLERRARRSSRSFENFGVSGDYALALVWALAAFGLISPIIAAAAISLSSISVIGNVLCLKITRV